MYRLSSIVITLLVGIVFIVECNVLLQQDGKFKRDLDVIRSFSFVVQMNPLIKTNKTYAIMNSNSQNFNSQLMFSVLSVYILFK